MNKFIDIDKYLTEGKEEELLKAIAKRKVEIAEDAKKKAEKEAAEKEKAAKLEKSRANVIKALKYYAETLLDRKFTDNEMQYVLDNFLDIEKECKILNELKSNKNDINWKTFNFNDFISFL